MIIAQVIGNVVATQKNGNYEGTKLLVVQPLDLDGSPRGDAMMAVDSISTQAGVGDKVLVVLEGWSASYAVRREQAPIDAAVVGVIDYITVKRET
jgi:ethanolamine utilization protein EutN